MRKKKEKLERLPEIIEGPNGVLQESKNIGIAPDGTLRVMPPDEKPKPKETDDEPN